MAISTSYNEDKNFKAEIASQLPNDLLQTAIEWIVSNLSPDQVFDLVDLNQWAESNGYEKP